MRAEGHSAGWHSKPPQAPKRGALYRRPLDICSIIHDACRRRIGSWRKPSCTCMREGVDLELHILLRGPIVSARP
jgi:hypothetical protein